MVTQRQIREWQGKDVDERQIQKYLTMCRGHELSERQTEIKSIGALMSFRGNFDLSFDHYYHYFFIIIVVVIIIIIIIIINIIIIIIIIIINIIIIIIIVIIISIYYFIIFSSGGFSETGCHVVSSKSNSEETGCSCHHLTHFAVLLDYNGSPGVINWFSPYL